MTQVYTRRSIVWRGLPLQRSRIGWGPPLASDCGAYWMHGNMAAALTSRCRGGCDYRAETSEIVRQVSLCWAVSGAKLGPEGFVTASEVYTLQRPPTMA